MCDIIIVIIILYCVAPSHAKNSMDKLTSNLVDGVLKTSSNSVAELGNNLVDESFNRRFTALSPHHAEMDGINLGKPGYLEVWPWIRNPQQFHRRQQHAVTARSIVYTKPPVLLRITTEATRLYNDSSDKVPVRHLQVASRDVEENPLSLAWSQYTSAAECYPKRTRMTTACFLASMGDVIAQIIEGTKEIVLARVLALVFVSVLYIVPMRSIFYDWNEQLVTRLGLKRGNWNTTGVMFAFNQLVSAPIQLFGFYFAFVLARAVVSGSFTALSELGPLVTAKIQDEYMSTLLTNWKVSSLPMLVNFGLVPPSLRVIFANCYDLVWTVILSILTNRR